MLQFDLLHYRQPECLRALFTEAQNFDPALVSFRLHDDGSPPEVLAKVREIISFFPGVKAELHATNRGVLAMLEDCLAGSKCNYTYVGAGDDATCPASIQYARRQLEPGRNALNRLGFLRPSRRQWDERLCRGHYTAGLDDGCCHFAGGDALRAQICQ
jgi:hypothetical protein